MTRGRQLTEAEKAEILHLLNRDVWTTSRVIQCRLRIPYWSVSYRLRTLLKEGRVERRKSPHSRREAEWRLSPPLES